MRDASSCIRTLATARPRFRFEARLRFAVLPSSIADPWDRAVEDYLIPVLSGVKPVCRITSLILGFIESVSVVCRRPTWPFGFGLEQMAVASISPTMLIGLDTAGRVALRAATPLRHS